MPVTFDKLLGKVLLHGHKVADLGDYVEGATKALDNLASVAINTSLISDTDSTDDLGSSSKFWKGLYIDNVVGPTTLNEVGADVDFRLEGDTDVNLLFTDASTDRVGIGTSGPGYKLDVQTASAGNFIRSRSGAAQDAGIRVENSNRNWVFYATASGGNFLIRDSTGGANPFAINAGSPDQSIVFGTSSIVINQANADLDFNIQGDVDDNLVFVDAGTGRIGIRTSSPSEALTIANGIIRLNEISAPGAASVATGASGSLTGNYLYKVTLLIGTYETNLGTASSTVSPSSQRVELTGIPTSSSPYVTARKIYRTAAGGSAYYLLTTINDNTTTTYSDNTVDGSLGTDSANDRDNTTSGYIFRGSEQGIFIGQTNTAVGRRALDVLTTGAYNMAFGYDSLGANTTGSRNTAIGVGALITNTTGEANLALGNDALNKNVSGSDNVALGAFSLYQNTGSSNVGLGRSTLGNKSSGGSNVAIGYLAGDSSTNSNYDANVFVGRGAGNGINGGSSNIFIGYQAGNNSVSGSSNILLGYDIDLQSASGSNQLSIGNIIFGTGLSSTGTTVSTGKIGIKNTAPNSDFDVTGTIQTDGFRLDVTPTVEVIVPTHTITISVNGTNYKIPIVAA